MGGGAQTTKQPVTIRSREFVLQERFVNLKVFTGTYREENDAPPVHIFHTWERVTNRWIYVLQMLGGDINCVGEYWVDGKGDYYPADMQKSNAKERQDRQPKKELLDPKNRQEKLSFHHTINGKRAYYAFYLSNARLALHSILRLERSDYFAALLPPDLSRDDDYRVPSSWDVAAGGEDPKLTEWMTRPSDHPDKVPDDIYIGVFDVLTYGMSLNHVMQQLRDLALAWFIPAQDLNDDQRVRTEQRQKKRILAGAIKALLDNEQTTGIKISDELWTGELDRWLDHYEQVRKQMHDDLEMWAKQLTDWLDSLLMMFTIEAHQMLTTADEKGCEDDLARFMMAYSACMDRLIESKAGFDWLSKTVADKSHFVHPWVLETSTSPRVYAKVFSKVPKAFLWMFKELFVPYRAKYGLAFQKTMVDPCYGTIVAKNVEVNLHPEQWVDPQTGHIVTVTRDADIRILRQEGPLPRAVVEGPGASAPHQAPGVQDSNATPVSGGDARLVQQASITQWEVDHSVTEVKEQTVTSTHTPDNWSKNIPKEYDNAIKAALNSFNRVLVVINLGLALYDLEDRGVNAQRVISATAQVMKTVTAFNELFSRKLSEKTLQEIGLVTAVYDCWTSTSSALKAKDSGDTTAAAGYLVAGLGSGMAAVGVSLALAGIETSWSGIGMILAIIGTAIALFGGKEPIQTFAEHCVWGKSYGQGGGDAKWQDGPFSSWKERNPDKSISDGLDRQLKSLFNLLRAFQINGANWGIAIQYGLAPAKMYVTFEGTVRKDVRRRAEYELDMRTHTLRLIRGRMSLYMPTDFAGNYDWTEYEDDGPLGITDMTSVDFVSSNRVWIQYKFTADTGRTADIVEPTCLVRHDVQGDQTEWVPPAGNWIYYKIIWMPEYADTWSWSADTVTSFDY